MKLVNLKSFSINRSKLDDRKTQILIQGLLRCPLEQLSITYCHLRCTNFLEEFCLKNKTLKILNLKGNNFLDQGVNGLTAALSVFEGHLQCLVLSRNSIESESFEKFLEITCNTKHINELDLAACIIKQSDIERLIKFCAVHGSLSSLNVSGIPMSDENGNELINMLKNNHKMRVIDVRECGLSESQEQKLRLLLERNKYIGKYPFLLADAASQTTDDVDSVINQK